MTLKKLPVLKPLEPSLSVLWTKALNTQADKDAFSTYLFNNSNHTGLMRLKKLLQERLDELEKYEITLDTYTCPSWSHKQAHINGSKHELNTLLKLLSFVK